ncbi:MAG TPA: hypothetical protein VI078_03380, partial [bacterium]
PEAGPPAWTLPPAVWRIRQVVLIEFGDARFPVQGYLELDTAKRTVRLVALDDFGVTFFKLTVTAGGESVDYMLPLVPRGDEVGRAVAASLRRIYLEPGCAVPGAGKTRLEAGPSGQVVSAAPRGGDGWEVRYDDYRDVDGTPVPQAIRYRERGGASITIRQVSVRRVDR